MSLKQKMLRDYLAENLPGALVTELRDAGQYQFVVFIPAELATHTITFTPAEFDGHSLEELVALLEGSGCFSLIETAAFSLDITFYLGALQARRRSAA